jgi:Permuted papain-like amidase enzyme, YaeF/YiiX, C92 family
MKCSELQVGDVILSTTSAAVSKVIKAGTVATYSHAMLYVGRGSIVEAVGNGVVQRSIKLSLGEARLASAFRLKDMTGAQAQKIADYAISKVGGSYAYGGVFGGSGLVSILSAPAQPWLHLARWGANKVKTGVGSKRTYFCSELVEDAFESEELTVSRYYPSMTNPGDIDEYSERNPTTFPKLGELDLPPDIG